MRPRILLLSAYYHPFQGGVETHARELARYLAAQDFTVTIVTKRPEAPRPRITHIDGLPVFRVPPAGPRTAVRKWLMIPFAFVQIVTLRNRFDLIYNPGYQGIGLAAIAAGALLRRPVILRSGNIGVLRGTHVNAPLARLGIPARGRLVDSLKGLLRRIYLSADAFVCNSREIEQEALACGVPRTRVHYLPNGVDVDRFRPAEPDERARARADAGWPADGLLCLYVGRLSVEKGVLDLLEAWRLLPPARRVLVLVGPDMPGSSMDAGAAARQYVAAHGLKDVIFHGPSEDVPRLLHAADVYVQPSHYEAFSNAVIEAMAAGLPIVASRVSGMLDALDDEDTALLSAAQSPADLARQLARVFADAPLRARLGAAARRSVVERFSQPVIFGRFAQLFAQTVRDRTKTESGHAGADERGS